MRVLVDCDGVVCNSDGAFRAALFNLTSQYYSAEDVTDWSYQKCLGLAEAEEALVWGEVGAHYLDFTPYPGAIEAVQGLIDAGHDVAFVTSPSPHIPEWTWWRNRWLDKHFTGVPVVHTDHKYLIGGDALIDDKFSNVAAWTGTHPRGLGILWAQPWNAGHRSLPVDICRTSDWNVVAKLLTNTIAVPQFSELDRVAMGRAP